MLWLLCKQMLNGNGKRIWWKRKTFIVFNLIKTSLKVYISRIVNRFRPSQMEGKEKTELNFCETVSQGRADNQQWTTATDSIFNLSSSFLNTVIVDAKFGWEQRFASAQLTKQYYYLKWGLSHDEANNERTNSEEENVATKHVHFFCWFRLFFGE